MKSINDSEDTNLDEILQLQKGSLINDPSTDEIAQTEDMTNDENTEPSEGPSASTRDSEIDVLIMMMNLTFLNKKKKKKTTLITLGVEVSL